jgi:hypothetical protein
MPFIRGRYYANPIAGEALEAAREAEARSGAAGGDEQDAPDMSAPASSKPVRRIVIEVTELVPAQTGRATKGFVAQVQREDTAEPQSTKSGEVSQAENRVFYDPGQLVDFLKQELATNGTCR